MTSPTSPRSSVVSPYNSHFLVDPEPVQEEPEEISDSDDERSHSEDTASQRSISLSSPAHSPRVSTNLNSESLGVPQQPESPIITPVTLVRQRLANRDSRAYNFDTDFSSEHDGEGDDRSSFMRRLGDAESPLSSAAPSLHSKEKEHEAEADSEEKDDVVEDLKPSASRLSARFSQASSFSSIPSSISYPPPPLQTHDPRGSMASFSSGSTSYSKKARPESMLVKHSGPLVLGIALVDFNHLVGPKIEFSRGSLFEDEEIQRILPFLALPDGAHLTVEDYSYFHLVPPSPTPTTVFGISCNRQIRAADLLVKDQDVTRSTVQKAVVVLASKPVFGPIRDRLGVITQALFAQRDFSDLSILEEFHTSLELSLKSQLTESGLYMGTSLRELVHTFRQRTLILLKALLLQKKIMFYGHPVERLCTYQYSLVTLVPGLLQNLDDCGSPPLAARAQTLQQPTELRTSDPKSMMAYIGLPLDLFGKDAFFQPYLPLQQLDMLRDTKSWLCGSTNSIVAQQKEVDLLVNVETGVFEFRDPTLERSAGLTPADRKWMDDILKDVNEVFDETNPNAATGIQFKGSDDYLRQKFDEYISGALSCVKYSNFMAKGQGNGIVITDGAGDPNAIQDFNLVWISEFKKTNAYEVWERVTDPMLFDIIEPRHPCSERPSVVSDIGLRLSEGIVELKLDQSLAPAREAVSRTLTAGSTSFFKAVEGVRGRWMARSASTSPNISSADPNLNVNSSSGAVEVIKSDAESSRRGSIDMIASPEASPQPPPAPAPKGMRPLSLVGSRSPPQPPPPEPKATFSSWGAGIGSFFSQRASRLSVARQSVQGTTPPREASPAPSATSANSRVGSIQVPMDLGVEELKPRNLDEVYASRSNSTTVTPEIPHTVPVVLQRTETVNSSTQGKSRISTETHRTRLSDDDEHGDPAGTGFAL